MAITEKAAARCGEVPGQPLRWDIKVTWLNGQDWRVVGTTTARMAPARSSPAAHISRNALAPASNSITRRASSWCRVRTIIPASGRARRSSRTASPIVPSFGSGAMTTTCGCAAAAMASAVLAAVPTTWISGSSFRNSCRDCENMRWLSRMKTLIACALLDGTAGSCDRSCVITLPFDMPIPGRLRLREPSNWYFMNITSESLKNVTRNAAPWAAFCFRATVETAELRGLRHWRPASLTTVGDTPAASA